MITSRLERPVDVGLLIVRIGFGLGFFWYHGWPKITGGPERWERTGAAMESVGLGFAPLWFGLAASIAEALGGLLIAFGLFFRPAAVAVLIVMVVATANHIVTGVGTPAHSMKNAWLFAGLAVIGPGRYSLDQVIASRRSATRRREPPGEPEDAHRQEAPVSAQGGR